MFRMVIDVDLVDPPLSKKGPSSIRLDIYVTGREEAHKALDDALSLMDVPHTQKKPGDNR